MMNHYIFLSILAGLCYVSAKMCTTKFRVAAWTFHDTMRSKGVSHFGIVSMMYVSSIAFAVFFPLVMFIKLLHFLFVKK